MDFETGFWPNVLGLAGVACNLGWPLFRRRSAMLWIQTAGGLLFAGHFLLVGAVTGALMTTLVAVQAALAVPLGLDPRYRVSYLAVLPVIAVAAALSWSGLPSAFAATAMTIISVGRYQLDVVRFRVLMLACIPFWTVHNVLVGSIPGLLSDALSFASGAWMLVVVLREVRSAPGAPPDSAAS